MNAVRYARWWVLDYAYAAWWQTRTFFDRTEATDYGDGTRTPILLLPGVYEPWRFMQPLAESLHRRGHPVLVVDALRRNRRPVLEMAEQVTEFLQGSDLAEVLIVAHSKGGLVGKQVMLGAAGGKVRAMVAIATPFGGSRLADLMWLPSLRSFSPRHATIVALAAQLSVNAKIVSVFGEFDPHIPAGSELLGARNVRLDTGGHFRILADSRILTEVEAFD